MKWLKKIIAGQEYSNFSRELDELIDEMKEYEAFGGEERLGDVRTKTEDVLRLYYPLLTRRTTENTRELREMMGAGEFATLERLIEYTKRMDRNAFKNYTGRRLKRWSVGMLLRTGRYIIGKRQR